MPSFDVVSKIDMMEVQNAVNAAQKEVATRYDFRGTNTEIEQIPDGIVIRSADDMHRKSAVQALRERFAKRGVSPRSLEEGKIEPATNNSVRQTLVLKQGIEKDVAKKIVKAIKDEKLKAQSQIQGDELRVTGKTRDDLQKVIGFLRGQDFGVDLQFENFRD